MGTPLYAVTLPVREPPLTRTLPSPILLLPQRLIAVESGTVLIEFRSHWGSLPGVNLMSLLNRTTVVVGVGVNPPVKNVSSVLVIDPAPNVLADCFFGETLAV